MRHVRVALEQPPTVDGQHFSGTSQL